MAAAPQDIPTLIDLGDVLFDLGKRMEARNQFEKALRLAPRDPRAHTGLGWVYLEAGESEAALRQFRQAQPPTLMALLGQTHALYRLNRFEEALEVIARAKQRFPKSPQPWTQAALISLVQGRVSEALAELDHALRLDPKYALAHGLRSNIYLVRNQKERALEVAQQAVAANPYSPTAHLDLSLVKQAEFKLEEALQAARKAVELDLDNPQALIQVSRLLFGQGEIDEAFKLAERARRLAPQDPVVLSTRGFLQLARGKVNEAIASFDRAIGQDSTRGEPHLGKGLALFRRGKTEDGVKEMRIATLLEPKVSLYHSYLGKAFYEVKEGKLAGQQLALAKEMDPRDPTPYFYDAIRKHSVNRPMEAVQDLQESIELNDNRAVYRSRLLLDEDLAARGAALGRIYHDLGFEQLALVEGWKSVATDPMDYPGHRLLADSYSVLPRHEVARVSELLQSQLLQPINLTPVQPSLAESDLLILEGTGPTAAAFNEFNPLFTRDRLALQISGIVGDNDTIGDEVVQLGVWQNLSYSLGQFHYETDGFRENNDLKQDIYNAFIQAQLLPELSLQTELRYRDLEHGNREFGFELDVLDKEDLVFRRNLQTDTGRIGLHYVLAPHSDIVASIIYQDETERTSQLNFEQLLKTRGYIAESQYVFHTPQFSTVLGGGFYQADTDAKLPPSYSVQHWNGYLYSYVRYPRNWVWTIGLSFDLLDHQLFEKSNYNRLNPKFGMIWNITPDTVLRLSAFRALKRALLTDQTIEPTHVAGFTQFFDDKSATESRRYGIALDHKFSRSLYSGVEFSKRDLKIPRNRRGATLIQDEQEVSYRAYLNWALHNQFAVSAAYEYEDFDSDAEFSPNPDTRTHLLLLAVRHFHPSGFFSRVGVNYINQAVKRLGDEGIEQVDDEFTLVDADIGYRFPRRLGTISIGVKNLFDQDFRFRGFGFRTSTDQEEVQMFLPERTVSAQVILSF